MVGGAPLSPPPDTRPAAPRPALADRLRAADPEFFTATRRQVVDLSERGLALREHGLGLAALDALAEGAPLWRRHELVFAILACESEPVDPRL